MSQEKTASLLLSHALSAGLCLLLAAPAQAGISQSPFPARDPESLAQCRSIFALLDAREQGIEIAQAEPEAETEVDETALASELSDMLQACSYDGSAISVSAKSLQGASSSDGEAVVKTIMRFTGLPQNFKVMEGPVPNAAAMIVLGPDNIPVRVIAYNVNFMDQVRNATRNNDWASISVMAHEIGHHLSGHTLMRGGSQPPIELEADKFSGFVLQKMGATLGDAQTAISTLVPEGDGPTHPGRAKRLHAILSGWTESCEQQAAPECAETEVAANPPAPQPAASDTPAPEVSGSPDLELPDSKQDILTPDLAGLSREELEQRLMAAMDEMGKPDADLEAITRKIEVLNQAVADAKSMPVAIRKPIKAVPGAEIDRMVKLDPKATPSKFDRFVYDELGLLRPDEKEKLAKAAYNFTEKSNIEVVTIIADDLQERSADQYALDAMRQLRVGKLEVGNGAVVVFAPRSDAVGIALGAGLLVHYKDTNYLRNSLDNTVALLRNGLDPAGGATLTADTAYSVMRDTGYMDWRIAFQSLEDMIDTAAKADAQLKATGSAYDPAKDPTAKKLARMRATIVSMDPSRADEVLDVNDIHEQNVGPAMQVRTAEGRDVIAYVNPNAAALMPVPLEAGKTYSFVMRESFLGGDTPQFDLISYDLVDG